MSNVKRMQQVETTAHFWKKLRESTNFIQSYSIGGRMSNNIICPYWIPKEITYKAIHNGVIWKFVVVLGKKIEHEHHGFLGLFSRTYWVDKRFIKLDSDEVIELDECEFRELQRIIAINTPTNMPSPT